jgi:UPF0755 protein
MKNFLVAFAIVIFLPLSLVVAGYWWYNSQTHAISASETTIEIIQGQGLSTIADRLEQAKIIPSALAFRVYCTIKGEGTSILPGVYSIPAGTNWDQLLAIISGGKHSNREVVITFPEGFTTDEIVAKITASLPLSSDTLYTELADDHWHDRLPVKFSDNPKLEGFLFPDTYRFKYDSSAEEVIQRFVDNFNNKWSSVPDKSKLETPLTDYEIVKLASIIEKESSNQTEREFISDILQSKLKNDEYLSVNATLNYVLNSPKAVFTSNETNSDSPYNSYKNKGLPPTPICNPSLNSLMAVLTPQPNNYQYYLHDAQGNIHFAETYQQHLDNIAKYLQ